VRHPQRFYQHLCLRSYHAEARRWLILTMAAVALSTVCIPIGLRIVTGSELIALSFTDWQFYAVFVAIGAVWSFLALMMVGIETAGLSFVTRSRQYPLDLASTSRITCYASTLLPFWVLLGSTQVIFMAWYTQAHVAARISTRWDSIISVGSLFAAHIIGLLWYEITVYRGLWASQYANR
jgi:hypothetical protein